MFTFRVDAADVTTTSPMVVRPRPGTAAQPNCEHCEPPSLTSGKTYLSAPGWPLSVGDVEQAIDLLERAVALRPTALARLFLAQAYAEDGRTADARRELRQALAAEGPAALEDNWREEAETLRARLGS